MKVDSNGNPPSYKAGDRVYVLPLKMQATVIEQRLHYDYPDSFWGNLRLRYDDGVEGESNSWQCARVVI